MRPPKRQRQNVILDSDDGDDDEKPQPTGGRVSSKAAKETGTTQPIQRASRTAAAAKTKRPAQPVATQRKGKSKATTLHSFFNARTQAQTSGPGSQSSSRGISPSVSLRVEDEVEEEDEDIEEVDAGSFRGKRKFTPVTPADVDDAPAAHNYFEDGGKDTKSQSLYTGSKPWVDQFPPVNAEELAIHKKKLGEVDEWLRSASTGHSYRRLLVLKGPAGSGKTATVSTLAQARGLQVVEWSNPSNTTYGDDGFQSASAQFGDFLRRSAPFASLSFDELQQQASDRAVSNEDAVRGRITLIEEVHVIARWSSALMMFRETIMLHLSSTVSHPIVIVLSEADSTFSSAIETLSAHQLLGPEILSHPAVSVIEFNPVAPTFIAKAIELVIKKEARLSGRRRIPGPSVLRALADTGDIRSAIGMLEMMCINENDSTLSGRVAAKSAKASKTKPALTAKEKATLDAISQRESTLGLFHAVGKVVYNKRENQTANQPPAYLNDMARPLSSTVDPDELFATTGTDVDTFVAALHENYALSCEADDPLVHIDACLDNLSDADMIASFDPVKGAHGHGRRLYQGSGAADGLRHDEMVFNTAVRGLLFSLPFPVKRKAKHGASKNDPYKIQYPQSVRLRREILDRVALLDAYRLQDASHGEGIAARAAAANRSVGNAVETWSSSLSTFPMIQRDPEVEATAAASSGGACQAMRRLDTKDMVMYQLPYASIVAVRKPTGLDSGLLDALVKFDIASRESGTSERAPAGPGRHGHFRGQGNVEEEPQAAERIVLSDDDIEDD